MHSEIEKVADLHQIFIDTPGPRAARKGKKISWKDNYGNSHDLDLVLEKDGSDTFIGTPLAFIECAWRRYTKHSKNKVQEIQGAVLPIVEKHSLSAPFFGAILAGEFTQNSLNQLTSLGFRVLYFPYASLVKAFSEFGLSMHWEEDTNHGAVEKMIADWENTSHKHEIMQRIVDLNQVQVNVFLSDLTRAIERHVTEISLLPLYGQRKSFHLAKDAITFLRQIQTQSQNNALQKIEVTISFSNSDSISASFKRPEDAGQFLEQHTYSVPTA